MKHSIRLVAALSLVPVVSAQQREFDVPWMAYPTSLYPRGLAPSVGELADMNGDGVLDHVSVSASANPLVAVLRGNGDGSFQDPIWSDLPTGSEGLLLADHDGDGDLDAFVAETGFGQGEVSLWTNSGTGVLTRTASWGVGWTPRGMARADFDGEGTLDILVACNGSLALLLGDGAGGFLPQLSFVVPNGAESVAAADLDGDGDVDALAAHTGELVTVLRNTGIGFDPPVAYATIGSGPIDGDPSVALADLDADGDLDCVYTSASSGDSPSSIGYGAAAILRNAGDGTFGAAETLPLATASDGGTDVELVDVDGDTHLDLLVPGGSADLWSLLRGDGAGGFLAAEAYRCGDGLVDVATGDLDADGDLEVVLLGSGSATVCVYDNPGDAAFVQPVGDDVSEASLAPYSFSDLATGDLNGDGLLDVVIGSSANFVEVYGIRVRFGLGDGTFGSALDFPTDGFAEHVAVRDLDGDGDQDVLWLDTHFDPLEGDPNVHWMLNQGDGTTYVEQEHFESLCGDEAQLDAFDVDGDGLRDLVVATCYGAVHVALNDGFGGFGSFLTHPISGWGTALAAGDFDGDGALDLATNSAVQGYLEVSLGNGDGTFQAPFTEVSARGVQAIEAVDVSGDGVLDLVCGYQLDGDGLTVLLGRGDGTFKPPATYPGAYSGSTDDVFVADVDGDGWLDALIANRAAQDVSFWRNRGDGTFEPQLRHGVGQEAFDLAVADLGGDGPADLLVLAGVHVGFYHVPSLVVLRGLFAPWEDVGQALAGTFGPPTLVGSGELDPGSAASLAVSGAPAASVALLVAGASSVDLPLFGGVLVPFPDVLIGAVTDASGGVGFPIPWPASLSPGQSIWFQTWIVDAGGPEGLSATNGLRATQP